MHPVFRDHGHGANLVNTLRASRLSKGLGEAPEYISATAQFFLAARQAIESGEPVTLTRANALGHHQ
jgi:hypothetical protein